MRKGELMKKSLVHVCCIVCAFLILIVSQPYAAYAEPLGKTPAESAAPSVSQEEIDAFFDNSVFVGDSVMEDFRNYSFARSDTWLGRLKFLAAVSFSTYSALRPVTSKSIHPIYAGEKRLVEDSIALMGAKKVFMLFGPNDINITGIEKTAANYVELAKRIRAQSPDVEFHIMSMPYTVKGHRDHNLYNDNIRKYNEAMKNLAAEQGWGFVDIANPMADENGDLIESYSSDRDIHLRRAAYDVWCQVLRDYAKETLIKEAEEAAAAGTGGPGVCEILYIQGEIRS